MDTFFVFFCSQRGIGCWKSETCLHHLSVHYFVYESVWPESSEQQIRSIVSFSELVLTVFLIMVMIYAKAREESQRFIMETFSPRRMSMRISLIMLSLGLLYLFALNTVAYGADAKAYPSQSVAVSADGAAAPNPAQKTPKGGEYPDQPKVRTDYRETRVNTGWAEPAARSTKMGYVGGQSEEYPDQPNVRTDYRETRARVGWNDSTR